MTSDGFDGFGLSDDVRQAIRDAGYTEPTDVQARSIPEVMAGNDVTVQSRTGTGKTAAFSIPIVQGIDIELRRPQALVLCPTRELALQVQIELQRLGKNRGIASFPIYGGASMRKQIDALRDGLHAVVGTPGRVLDHLRSRRLHFDDVKYLVLDEADELLSMGFYEEVSNILERVPQDRQTMLFSATLPPGVEGLIYRYQREPVRIELSSDTLLVDEIHHAYYICRTMDKAQNLAQILLNEEPTNAIIFVNTRDEARVVTGYLRKEGFEAEMLSGELSQNDRERVMGKIKRNELRFMVATDVAARGIDISDLSHVINYSVPDNKDVYVHRTGRTGRIGKTGTAITLVGLRDLPKWGDIERMKGLTIEERKPPTEETLLEGQVDAVIHSVRHLAAQAIANPLDTSPERPPPPAAKFILAAERLLEQAIEPTLLARLLERSLAPPPDSEPIASIQRETAAADEDRRPEPERPPRRERDSGRDDGRDSGRRRRQRPRSGRR